MKNQCMQELEQFWSEAMACSIERILASYLNENKQYYNSSFQPI